MEALKRVTESARAYHIQRLEIVHNTDLDRDIERIRAVDQLLTYLFSLPSEPIGNVRELRLTLVCFKLTEFGHRVGFITGVTAYLHALAVHKALGSAVGAEVQRSFKTVGTERLVRSYTVFLLSGKIIKCECHIEFSVKLLGGEIFNIFFGEEGRNGCADRHLAYLKLVV